MQCPIEDVFFGGARGGGKTDGLLGDFLAHAGRYGKYARGILFRRTLTELEDIIKRSHEIYTLVGAKYNIQKHEWTFSNGATLRMRYLDNDADASNYQGHAYTWMGFDELPHWPRPEPIDKLWACLRSAHGVPCMRRSTGNPGGPGHVWVKQRYRVQKPLVPFEYEPHPGAKGPNGQPLTIRAVFIPSRLEDNPLLMQNDPMYETRLAGTGALFQAWRYGNWDVLAGQYFDIWNPAEHVATPSEADPPAWATCWISGDWGFNDSTVILWHWMDENQRVYTYREIERTGLTPREIGQAISAATPLNERVVLFPFSPETHDKRTSPKSIADEIGHGLRKGLPVPMRADDERVSGWQLMYQMLKFGQWKISSACPVLIESIPQLIRDELKDPNDIAESPVDHAPDAARYGLKTYVRESKQVMEEIEKQKLAAIADETSRNIAWMQANSKRWAHGKLWRKPRRFLG